MSFSFSRYLIRALLFSPSPLPDGAALFFFYVGGMNNPLFSRATPLFRSPLFLPMHFSPSPPFSFRLAVWPLIMSGRTTFPLKTPVKAFLSSWRWAVPSFPPPLLTSPHVVPPRFTFFTLSLPVSPIPSGKSPLSPFFSYSRLESLLLFLFFPPPFFANPPPLILASADPPPSLFPPPFPLFLFHIWRAGLFLPAGKKAL